MNSSQYQRLNHALVAFCLAVIVWLMASHDFLLEATRPLVNSVLHLTGQDFSFNQHEILIGRMSIPWTQDCAGLNVLFVLLAVTVWLNRGVLIQRRFWICLAAALPLALLANTARVLTLIAYRHVIYPTIEAPSVHYFMGLLWLAPMIVVLAPRDGRPRVHKLIEGVHAAAVVALLTPQSGMPNGALAIAASILVLMDMRLKADYDHLRRWLLALWTIIGCLIAIGSVESFWLPWLLLCPLMADATCMRHPSTWLLVACSHSVLLLVPGISWLGYAAVIWRLGSRWGGTLAHGETQSFNSKCCPPATALTCVTAMLLPFTAPLLLEARTLRQEPPLHVQNRALGAEGFALRLPDQPNYIDAVWYGPASRDRHHSLKVCMKFRGLDLSPSSAAPLVLSDEEHWFKEYFILDSQLIASYPDYLRRTFRPFANPGAHIIFVADKNSTNAAEFQQDCDRLAHSLLNECIRSRQLQIAYESEP